MRKQRLCINTILESFDTSEVLCVRVFYVFLICEIGIENNDYHHRYLGNTNSGITCICNHIGQNTKLLPIVFFILFTHPF